MCKACGELATWSRAVLVIVVFAPLLSVPFPLLSTGEYCYCRRCNAVVRMIDLAAAAHPVTAAGGKWTRAVVLHVDGSGLEVKRQWTQAPARA